MPAAPTDADLETIVRGHAAVGQGLRPECFDRVADAYMEAGMDAICVAVLVGTLDRDNARLAARAFVERTLARFPGSGAGDTEPRAYTALRLDRAFAGRGGSIAAAVGG